MCCCPHSKAVSFLLGPQVAGLTVEELLEMRAKVQELSFRVPDLALLQKVGHLGGSPLSAVGGIC